MHHINNKYCSHSTQRALDSSEENKWVLKGYNELRPVIQEESLNRNDLLL